MTAVYQLTSGAKDAHQVVVERQEENAGTGVALATGTTAKLVVDTAGFVAFGTENMQSAQIHDAVAQLDVGAATGHIRGDGDIAAHRTVCGRHAAGPPFQR